MEVKWWRGKKRESSERGERGNGLYMRELNMCVGTKGAEDAGL